MFQHSKGKPSCILYVLFNVIETNFNTRERQLLSNYDTFAL